MLYLSIWTRTTTAQQNTLDKRFVDPHGRFGGYQGVSLKPAQEGTLLSVLTLGEAEVELASGQNLVAGDLVKGDNQGLAVKSTDGIGACVLEVKNNTVYVIVR